MKSSSLPKIADDRQGLSTLEYSVLFVVIVVGALGFWSKLSGELTITESHDQPVSQSTPE